MVPISPATGSNRLVCLFAGLNPHVWNPTSFLPIGYMLRNIGFHRAFALEVLWSDRAKFKLLAFTFWASPLDCINALLKDVIWSRKRVGFIPHSEPIAGGSVRTSVVPPHSRNFGAVFAAVNCVCQIGVLTLPVGANRSDFRSSNLSGRHS